MFSVMRIINLAHGSLAVLAAFALFVLADQFGISPFLGLLIVTPAMAVVGWLLQIFILERASRAGRLVPILATFGLSILIDNVLFQQFGANTRSLAPYIGDLAFDSWQITDDIAVGKLAVLTLAAAIAILGAIQLFLNFTQLGRAVRATADDADTAGLLGIDARKINALATAVGMATVTLAGAALGMRATFDAYSGGLQLLFAFEAAVIGGAGSVWGTLFGGIILALGQSVGATIAPQGFLIGGHVAFFLVLFARLAFPGSTLRSFVAGALRGAS